MDMTEMKEVERLVERMLAERAPLVGLNYLSADELGELVGCKANQRTKMTEWLKGNRWRYEVGANGLPRVARAYHDRKMGISEEKVQTKYADSPNLEAFIK